MQDLRLRARMKKWSLRLQVQGPWGMWLNVVRAEEA